MAGIAGVFGRNAILNINDCRGFLNRSQTNYDRRKTGIHFHHHGHRVRPPSSQSQQRRLLAIHPLNKTLHHPPAIQQGNHSIGGVFTQPVSQQAIAMSIAYATSQAMSRFIYPPRSVETISGHALRRHDFMELLCIDEFGLECSFPECQVVIISPMRDNRNLVVADHILRPISNRSFVPSGDVRHSH
jgi:hypothetical protein